MGTNYYIAPKIPADLAPYISLAFSDDGDAADDSATLCIHIGKISAGSRTIRGRRAPVVRHGKVVWPAIMSYAGLTASLCALPAALAIYDEYGTELTVGDFVARFYTDDLEVRARQYHAARAAGYTNPNYDALAPDSWSVCYLPFS